MIKNFVFLGTPGVGKGTIAEEVAKDKGIIHISTGNVFREHIKKETQIGLMVKEILSSGKYVPDKIVNMIVKEKLYQENAKINGFILDGYPRTINQAEFLKSIIDKKSLSVVLLESNQEVIFKRLAKRARDENRKDDFKEIALNRIAVYNEKTTPLIDYYENKNQLIRINVEGTVHQNVKNFYKECFIDNN